MKKITTSLLACLIVAFAAEVSTAQDSNNIFKEQFNGQFNYSSQRLIDLAQAMPAEKFSWSPDGEAYTFERVYMHIARYNYLYPETSLGISAPEDIDLEYLESITGKEEVITQLERSVDHVKEVMKQMPDSKLNEEAELYGRTVNGQAVLMQLITHMSEHVGQAISYARMNDVVPPWNR